MHREAGGAAGAAGSLGGRQRGVPEVGVKAPAVDLVGVARDDIEQRRHHLVGFDQARGAALAAHRRISAAMPGVLAPAPGLTMLTEAGALGLLGPNLAATRAPPWTRHRDASRRGSSCRAWS